MKLNNFRVILITSFIIGCSVLTVKAFDWWSAGKAAVKTYQALSLSDKDVAAYVRQAVNYMDRQNKVASSSSSYAQRLKRLTSGLTSVDGVPLNFKVYITSDVNAFACADGSVRVYSSLMDLMTDNELLGVIGHEIGHVGLHHSRKAMRNELLTGALRDALISTDGRLASLAASQLGALSEVMVNAKYSRSQEQEADDYGYKFLKKHNKNPWGMPMALEKLKASEKKSSKVSKYVNKMFSSHPDTDSRIKRLSEKCKKDGYTRPSK